MCGGAARVRRRTSEGAEVGQSILRLFTPTNSVDAARSNVAAEIVRAIMRTVLLDHSSASRSMNRFDDTSDACAKSPTRAPFTVTSSSAVAPWANFRPKAHRLTANRVRLLHHKPRMPGFGGAAHWQLGAGCQRIADRPSNPLHHPEPPRCQGQADPADGCILAGGMQRVTPPVA